jgi:uncharacterized repeat protein (TIGR01451 family)
MVFESGNHEAPADQKFIYQIDGVWVDSPPIAARRGKVTGVGMIILANEGRLLSNQVSVMKLKTRTLPLISQTTIRVRGQATYNDLDLTTGIQHSNSNPALHIIANPDSAFFTDSLGIPVGYYRLGQTIYMRLLASSINQAPAVMESGGNVALDEATAGDREISEVIESGENTGLFLSQAEFVNAPSLFQLSLSKPIVPAENESAKNKTTTAAKPNDSILQLAQNSTLYLSHFNTVNKGTLGASVLIDPSGVVFDSVTNKPVSGVTVTLVDAVSGGAVSGIGQNPVTTGADGRFLFDAPPGEYKLFVGKLPSGFSFPSVLPPANLAPGGRTVDPQGSYAQTFTLTTAVAFDIPIDPTSPILFVQKTANKREAEIGDVITYTVKIKNTSVNLPVLDILLLDHPPVGISYLPGSATCMPPLGATPLPLADPIAGHPMTFALSCTTPTQNRLGLGEEATLTYRAIIGPGAMISDGVNRAKATGRSMLGKAFSNEAALGVKIVPGVFTDRAILIGKVFIDLNGNGDQNEGEPGVPAARLILEDGTSVMTDEDGKYSLYGLTRTTHVLKLDPATFPSVFLLADSSTRFAGDPRSRFIDLTHGELHKANFTIAALPQDVWEPIIKERKGQVGGKETSAPSETSETTDTEQKTSQLSLQAIVAAALPNLTIVSPLDQAILPIRSTNLIITGHSGINFKLRVNDRPVGDNHVGMIVVASDKSVAGIEWIAVPLDVGQNRIEVEGYDAFGNLREAQVITLLVPGKISQVTITADPKEIPADGITPATISVSIFDPDGLPVLTREFLTVATSHGRLIATDLDPDLPDHQIAISKGRATLRLIPSGNVEDATVTVKGLDGVSDWGQVKVSFLPALREIVAVGILDGTLNLRNFKGNVMPITPDDRFAESLTEDGRAAFYIKGKVLGSALLTLAYDSDKGQQERLFRDIQPNEFYPIYGDASVKEFDAQSTGRLYVKVEKGKGYLLFGDFSPDFTGNELAAYQRALNGLKYHYEDENRALTAFHNRSRQKQSVERIRGNGTSGFYQINQFPVVENSEQIEIITVDRERPEIVIASETKARFVDYTLDTRTGQILFRAPVPSFDANFNPVFIKVSYETEGPGIGFDTVGLNGKIKLTDRIQIGGTLVQSDEPQNRFSLYGADLRLKFSEGVIASWEIAESKTIQLGVPTSGSGWKGTLSIKPNKMIAADLYRIETDPSFKNPSSNIAGGKIEQGITTRFMPREGTLLGANAIQSMDEITGTYRFTADLKMEQALGNAKGEIGLKHIEDQTVTEKRDADTARAKIMTPFPGLPELTSSLEYEQTFKGNSNIITLGNDYQLAKNTKLRSKQEWISGGSQIPIGIEAGRNGIARAGRRKLTTVGIDSTVSEGTTAFSEYRIAQSISGREDQAAIGLRNRFAIQKGVTLSSSFEQTETIEGPEESDSTAFSMGLEHLARPDLKGTTRFEIRKAEIQTSYLGTLAITYKVNPNVSLLGRETLFAEDGKQQTKDKLSSLLTFGVAVRPVETDQVHLLFKSEFKYDSEGGSVQPGGGIGRIFAGSLDANIQVLPKTLLFLKYANRMIRDNGNFHSTTQMLASRVTYDLTPKIDLGLEGRHFWQDRSASKVWGYSVEGGYRLATNLWLSVGYQVNGYDQESFTEEHAFTQGAFVRLRYKFDEHIADFMKSGPMPLKEERPAPILVPIPVLQPTVLFKEVTPQAPILVPAPVIPPPPVLIPVPIPELGVSYQEEIPPPPIIEINGMDPRVHFEFTDTNFKFDSSVLTRKGKAKAAEYAAFLKQNPTLEVTISGHTDRRGPKEYNDRLGLWRARSVWKALKRHKVKNKMEIVSYGENRPADSARTKAAHAKNRRVELRVNEQDTQEGR